MAKNKVSIDAGHSLITPGKRTPKLNKDLIVNGKVIKEKGQIIHEFEFNIKVAKALKEALERCGIEVKIVNDETGKVDTPLSTRANRANIYNSNLHISCHYNAVGSCASFQNRCHGVLVLRTRNCSNNSIKLANCVHDAIKNNYNHTYGVCRDVDMSGFTLAILRQTNMPAILIEFGFMDYEDEAMKMLQPTWYKKLAEDTCKGICKYLGIAYKEIFKPYISKPTVNDLNCRKGPGIEYDVKYVIGTDIAITIVEEKQLENGSVWCKAKSNYWVNKKYLKFIRYV